MVTSLNVNNLTQNRYRHMVEYDNQLILFTDGARYAYVLLTIVGVSLNAYVLFRLVTLACVDKKRFRNGTGLPLTTMCFADLITMLSIIIEVCITALLSSHSLPLIVRSLHCKVN